MLTDQDKSKKLIDNLAPEEFKANYWLKSDLRDFCTLHAIAAEGSKEELTIRIETFLRTGKKIASIPKQKVKGWDCEKKLTRSTLVVNYKSDPATRAFFETEIGNHFHFTAHLHEFRRTKLAKGEPLTYGDLIDEWKEEYERRRDPNYVPLIPKSCEFNQFMRDFFASEKGVNRTRKKAFAAWRKARSLQGPHTYKNYKVHCS